MRKKIIRISSFNALNLVLPEHIYYETHKYSYSDYAKKIDWMNYQLSQMNSDIIGFQEIFHKEALEELVQKGGMYKDAEIHVANPTGNLPRVAVLSRFPVEEIKIYEDFPQNAIIDIVNEDTNDKAILPFKKFSRPVLRAKIRVYKGFSIYVYVVHLKSKRPMLHDNEDRDNPMDVAKAKARSLFLRAAEATALRSLLMQTLQNKKLPVVLLGDVNDTGLSVTTKIVSGEPPHRRLPFDVKKRLWDVLLYHVKDIQARKSYSDFYYTHIHNGHFESLDHIMVSEELVAENPKHLAKIGYVTIMNDHLIDRTLTNQKPRRWKSDHGLVTTTVELMLDKIDALLNQ